MKIKKQPNGTALSADELKSVTALLVKLGYAVYITKEKSGGNTATVINAEERSCVEK